MLSKGKICQVKKVNGYRRSIQAKNRNSLWLMVLLPSQNTILFGFKMHYFWYAPRNTLISRYTVQIMYLEKPKQIIFWNEESNTLIENPQSITRGCRDKLIEKWVCSLLMSLHRNLWMKKRHTKDFDFLYKRENTQKHISDVVRQLLLFDLDLLIGGGGGGDGGEVTLSRQICRKATLETSFSSKPGSPSMTWRTTVMPASASGPIVPWFPPCRTLAI